MAIKFNENKVRLWKGKDKARNINLIGIRFHRDSNTKEIEGIYKVVLSLLELKYGKGLYDRREMSPLEE